MPLPPKPQMPMPNYVHHTFNEGGVAIWHITETADELYDQLATTRYDVQLLEKKNEARRAEWLAVRLLVKQLFGSKCQVAYHPSGAPYLEGSDMHISISHTRNYAAVAYHRTHPIGVDIEHISSRVERIVSRFTSEEEAAYIDQHGEHERMMYHLINWSAKETLYKLFSSPALAEFKEAFHITPYALETQGTLHANVCHENCGEVEIRYCIFPDFVCTCAYENLKM